jgi:hypothetical protein
LEWGGKVQKETLQTKVVSLRDPKHLDQVMRRIFDRTTDMATKNDSTVFLTACQRRLNQLLSELKGLTA